MKNIQDIVEVADFRKYWLCIKLKDTAQINVGTRW